MAFRHTYALQIKTTGQLSIDFTSRGDYYLSDSREKSLTGLSALHALLVCHCGLKEKEDFEVVSKDKANPSITIHRNANIVIALNFLLGNAAAPLFELYSYSYSPQNNPKQQWLIYLGKTIVSCIEDKSLMRKEYETIYPVMRAYLDSQYELLKKEPAVTMLKTAADENYGGDLLKHPFYQTLSILMDDYDTRKGAYKKKGFFEKIGETKPDKSPCEAVYKKFIDFIPSCFCDVTQVSAYSAEKVLSADKLRQSRQLAEAQETKSASSNPLLAVIK